MSILEGKFTTANATMQRLINSRAVLGVLRSGARPISDLASEVGLSRTATEAIVGDLVEAGWLRAIPARTTGAGPGRPARWFEFIADAGIVGGIDIGSHTIRAAVSDLSGSIIAQTLRRVSPGLSAAARLDCAAELMRTAVAQAAVTIEDLWAVAVASPGVVQDGVVSHFIGMPQWVGQDIKAELGTRLARPIIVENDCNAAALAERWVGQAQGVSDLVFVLIGNRTGAGLVLNGQLYRGWRGGSGELGALEAVGWLDAPRLVDEARVDGKAVTRKELFNAARAGNPEAREAVAAYTGQLAIGIAGLQLTLDPQQIVIGGGVAQAGETLLAPLRQAVDRLAIVRAPQLRLSSLGADIVAVGCLRVALDEIERRLDSVGGLTLPAPGPDLLESP
ncbi:MAG: ROK family protein [Arachnia sp.]